MFGYPWWVTLFFVIGVLATGTAILSLFFAFGRRPEELWATCIPFYDSQDFLRAIAGVDNAPVGSGGTAEVLNNGDEFYPAMLRAIGAAERSVTFMVYIWEDGKVSDQLLDAMIEGAQAGVEVRVLLDSFGAMNAPGEKFDKLRAAGGKVATFRGPKFGKLRRFHRRNHRRAIVIDGRVGFTGGAAVGDKWRGDARNTDEWREIMVRVTGPLARGLQAAFAQLWANTVGEILAGPAFYPTDEETEEGNAVCRHVHYVSSPSDEAHPLRKAFGLSFMAARERLYITSAYFAPDAHMRQEMIKRARLGVDVRVLTANEYTDLKPVRWAGHSYYEELLAGGVRIYEYQRTFLHSKVFVGDGIWSVVGSANMDVRSKELNEENVIGILDRGFGEQLERTFFTDLERSREIQLDEWRQRGLWQRFLERFFVLFVEQY